MRKVIAAINMTIDGVCDHTVGLVDEELHRHYAELINSAGIILYGNLPTHAILANIIEKSLRRKINGRLCNFNR